MRQPTPEETKREAEARRLAAYREANKKWPLPVSGVKDDAKP